VVQPRHRNNPKTLSRWTRMLAAPSRDGRVCKPIVAEHWDTFQRAHPRYQTAYDDSLGAKMRACGNPEQIGYIEYRCLHCGQGKPLVAMSGQSSLGLRCAKVYADTWVDQGSQVLHAGVISRQSILTVPAMCRPTFYQNAAVVLSAFRRCGRQCLDDCSSTVQGKALQGGSITVLHTHGRSGQSHPPLHVLATRGGYDTQGARWEHLPSLPSARLRRKGQWHLLTMLRQRLKTEAGAQVVDGCVRKYPDGLVTNVHKGHVPAQAHSVARSVAQSVVSPPMAVRRIDRDAGARVTSHDRSHRTDRRAYDTVPVDPCLGRMVQHTRPKGLQRIRYDGVPATKTFGKVQEVIQAALAKVEKVGKGAVKRIARLPYRPRDEQSMGRDPLRCSHGQREMAVGCLWHPTYGVIYDAGEVIKRGTYASTAPRAGP
jgi:hypothetical protein